MGSDLREKINNVLDLLKKHSIRDYEIFASHYDVIVAESKLAKPSWLNRSNESGISIRLLINGSMGFAYAPEPSDNLVKAAITSATHQYKDKYFQIPLPQGTYQNISIFDPKTLRTIPEDCISQAVKLEMSARDADERIEQVRKSSFSRSVIIKHIVNSNGIDQAGQASFGSASIQTAAKSNDEMQTGYEFGLSHKISEIDVSQIGKAAALKAVSMLGARRIKTMKAPVLFDNSTTSTILGFISYAFLGENISKDKSFLKGKLGTRCFSEEINLCDNPLDDSALDAMSFDGEGIPSQVTPLVEKGVVRSFLYDSYWGNVAKMTSTGNSRRDGFRMRPALGVRHLCMNPGREDMATHLQGIKQGLKITDIMGMHTADPITGDFSVGINGYLLEHGQSVYAVREAVISGNFYDIFNKVIATGNDLREFGRVKCPSMLVDSIDISSK
ncbi:MAG: TldD/PmbA family protein [Deltaproteobacteria bacterium]|nr:TldD/PmbA family protein [Deltaproteobacteria bacterium]